MNLNMEIGKKKDLYPSKKSINLCYQEDVSTQISTVLLRVIFIAVIVIAFIKVLVCSDTIDVRVQQIIETKKELGEYLVDGITDAKNMSNELTNELRSIITEL